MDAEQAQRLPQIPAMGRPPFPQDYACVAQIDHCHPVGAPGANARTTGTGSTADAS